MQIVYYKNQPFDQDDPTIENVGIGHKGLLIYFKREDYDKIKGTKVFEKLWQ